MNNPEELNEEELDEEELFEEIHLRLQKLSEEFDKDFEQVTELYERSCCDLTKLRKALEGTYKVWTDEQDFILQN